MEAVKTYFGTDESTVEINKKKRVVEKAASLYDLRIFEVKSRSFHFLQVEGASQGVRRFVHKSAYSWKTTAINTSKGTNATGTETKGAKGAKAGTKATGPGAKAGTKTTGPGAKAGTTKTISDFFPYQKVAKAKRGCGREPTHLKPYAATLVTTPDPVGGAGQKVVCRAVYFQSDPWENWQRLASAVSALGASTGASTLRVDSLEDAERRFQVYQYFRLYGTDVHLQEAEQTLKATFGDTFLHDKFAQISMSTGTRRGVGVVPAATKDVSGNAGGRTAATKQRAPAKKPRKHPSSGERTEESDGGEDMLYDECNIDAIKQGVGWGNSDDDRSDDDRSDDDSDDDDDDDTDPRVSSKRRR